MGTEPLERGPFWSDALSTGMASFEESEGRRDCHWWVGDGSGQLWGCGALIARGMACPFLGRY